MHMLAGGHAGWAGCGGWLGWVWGLGVWGFGSFVYVVEDSGVCLFVVHVCRSVDRLSGPNDVP